ncbi:MAG TPA: plastocyanin/azurin family copper-binding protein [Nitrososphaerales archaeon]|nr:plastocyanin/azurin family copper-binding protein [Nitrososphaerales archaeon]
MILSSVPPTGEAAPPKPRSDGRWKIVVVVIAIIGVAAFSEVLSFYYPENASSAPYLVTVKMPNGAAGNSSMTFTPQTVTLVLGVNNTVQWINLDQTPNVLHTVVFTQVPTDANFTAASISSYPNSTGIRYDVYYGPILLSAPGVYLYHCYYHPWMTGTIIVKA